MVEIRIPRIRYNCNGSSYNESIIIVFLIQNLQFYHYTIAILW